MRMIVAGAGLIAAAMAAAQSEPPVKLAEFIVTPSRYGVAEERMTTSATLTSQELEALPQLGDDLYRSIARLPGLAADDFTAQFWVRGAPHTQVLARFDGVDLIEPFHLKDVDGALSLVDPQTISRLDLITGGFTAEYGDRLAAVLTLETKRASAAHSALGLSLTGVGGMALGRTAAGRASWLAAARRGYPDVALRMAGRADEVYPRYYDVTAKLEYQLSPDHVVSVHALHAGDTLRYEKKNDPALHSGYDSDYLWARWRGTAGPTASGEAVLSGTRLTWKRDGSGSLDGFPFALRDQRRLDVTALRNEWTVRCGDAALLRSGFEASTGEARYDYQLSRRYATVDAGRQLTVPVTRNTAIAADGHAFGGFGSARVRWPSGLVLEPGLRFDRHSHAGDRDVSPRINVAQPLGRATWRAAWGEYRQAQGLHELAVADGDTTFRRAERAEHRICGVEYPLWAGTALRVEAYERLTSRLRPRWENLDNPYDIFPEAQPDRVRLDPRRGRARGVEFMLHGRSSTLSWNAHYALARAEEEIGGRWVPRSREQRHTLETDITYTPNRRWQFSAAWQFHTGWPTTEVVYSLPVLANGRRVLASANGALYGVRLPDYHRLDLRATRRFDVRRGELRAFLDLFNAYDRTNLVGYNHDVTISGAQLIVARKPREQLPVLPSVGVSWER